jgi:sirohydrochlorin cobaltochelatase
MSALTGQAAPNRTHDLVRVEAAGAVRAGTTVPPATGATRAAVVLVGGHEGGADVAVGPSRERGPLLRAASAHGELRQAVRHALEMTDQPVCVVPMTLGRDPGLVTDTARTLMSVTAAAAAGRIVLAEPFGSATLLTGWLRVAVAQAIGPLAATDHAVVMTANAANRFDDAELYRIAHLVKVRAAVPWVEVAFHGGDPGLAEVLDRCETLGARRTAVVCADFGSADTGPLLSPATVSGVLATRVAAAMLKLGRGDDGIAHGLRHY